MFCLGGAGYLAMLSADGRERIRVWGRLVSLWRGTGATSEPAPRAGHPGAGGGGPAGRAASIVLALCVPLLVPGLHPSKLFSSGPGIGGSGTAPAPLALPSTLSQAVNQLRDTHPSVEFSYTTTASARMESNDAQYFRQYVFDTLADGTGWEVTGYPDGAAPAESMPQPQGLADHVVATASEDGRHREQEPSLPLARSRPSCRWSIRPLSFTRRETGWPTPISWCTPRRAPSPIRATPR